MMAFNVCSDKLFILSSIFSVYVTVYNVRKFSYCWIYFIHGVSGFFFVELLIAAYRLLIIWMVLFIQITHHELM